MNEVVQRILNLCRSCDDRQQCGFGRTCRAHKKRIIEKASKGWIVARQQCKKLDKAAKALSPKDPNLTHIFP